MLTACLNRFIGRALPDSITTFESTLFPPFTQILQGDIDRAYLLSVYFSARQVIKLSVIEYIPYVFQIAQGRTSRLPHPPSLPRHASDLGTERLHSRTRLAIACLPFARCCGDGRRRPAYPSAGNCTAEARAEQSKRWLGLRTLAECRAPRPPVSEPYLWRFVVMN